MATLYTIGAVVVLVLLVLLALLAVALGAQDQPQMSVTGGAGDRPAVRILVPFRAGTDQPERREHLRKFLDHFAGWAAEPGHHIYIVEQAPGLPFNRGALLNAGFDIARGRGGTLDDIYVFHDVDLLPDPALLRQYGDPPPVHFAANWDRYGGRGKQNSYLGGVLSLSGAQFVRTGGFPNDFWGWGGEDDVLRDRVRDAGLWGRVRRPAEGRLEDLEEMDLSEKLAYLKARKLKFMRKREQVQYHRGRRRQGKPPEGVNDVDMLYEEAQPDGAGDNPSGFVARADLPHVELLRVRLRRVSPLATAFWARRPRGCGAQPHADEFQRELESRIPEDLASFPDRGLAAYRAMRRYAKASPKYLRSCVFVEASDAGGVRCEVPRRGPTTKGPRRGPTSKGPRRGPTTRGREPDSRVHTFVAVVRDLVAWCRAHEVAFPAGRFVIYVTDTYAWEETAKALPWMVVARPANRPGILVPDDSFVTHGPKGERVKPRPGRPWAWDEIVRAAAAAPPPEKTPGLFFAGANTGADKYAVRKHLAAEAWGVPARIELQGENAPRARSSVLSWGAHGALLNLPGHQPWSYRLKYLFLSGSPVFNVEVTVAYPGGDFTDRWVQFFSHLFVPGRDYVGVVVADRDGAPPAQRALEARRAREQIEAGYRALAPAEAEKMARSARGRASRLSKSRLLQYLHTLLGAYAQSRNES